MTVFTLVACKSALCLAIGLRGILLPYANYKAVETNPWAVVTFAVLGLSVQEAKCIKGDKV